MGNNHQSVGQTPSEHSKLIESQANYEVYQSPTGQEFEKYEVVHDGSEHFQQLYKFRVENRHADLVDLLYAGPAQGFMVCTQRSKFEVITERIPYRLQTLTALHPRNSLVILRTALRGFRDIYRRHGVVGVCESMIGINSKNRVKVWLNRNYAINQPEPAPNSYEELSPANQEREMVMHIFDLVDCKTEHDALWLELLKMKEKRNPSTFDQALNLVDYFSGTVRVDISDTVNNLFNKKVYHHNEQVAAGVGHSLGYHYHDDKIGKLNQQFNQIAERPAVNGPFYSIHTPISHLPAVPISRSYIVAPPAPISTPVSGHITQSLFIPQTIPNGNRPAIRFNIKTKNEEPLLIQNASSPQLQSQQPRQIQIIQNQTPNIAQKQEEQNNVHIIVSQPVTPSPPAPSSPESPNRPQEESAPTFTNLPVNDHSQPKSKPQTLQSIQPRVQIKQAQSFQPAYEQQPQIFLPEEKLPIVEQHRSDDPVYEVNVHEVSSQESIHEQLATLLTTDENKENQSNLPSPQTPTEADYKIVLTLKDAPTPTPSPIPVATTEQNSIKNLESLKSAINPSLVDTREIKRKSAESQNVEELRSGLNFKSQRGNNISYREMRRMLLEELSN